MKKPTITIITRDEKPLCPSSLTVGRYYNVYHKHHDYHMLALCTHYAPPALVVITHDGKQRVDIAIEEEDMHALEFKPFTGRIIIDQ